jgi:hypothetical protein
MPIVLARAVKSTLKSADRQKAIGTKLKIKMALLTAGYFSYRLFHDIS